MMMGMGGPGMGGPGMGGPGGMPGYFGGPAGIWPYSQLYLFSTKKDIFENFLSKYL